MAVRSARMTHTNSLPSDGSALLMPRSSTWRSTRGCPNRGQPGQPGPRTPEYGGRQAGAHVARPTAQATAAPQRRNDSPPAAGPDQHQYLSRPAREDPDRHTCQYRLIRCIHICQPELTSGADPPQVGGNRAERTAWRARIIWRWGLCTWTVGSGTVGVTMCWCGSGVLGGRSCRSGAGGLRHRAVPGSSGSAGPWRG